MPDTYNYADYPANANPRFDNSKTFGEAIKFRISKQSPSSFGKNNPLGSKDNPKY